MARRQYRCSNSLEWLLFYPERQQTLFLVLFLITQKRWKKLQLFDQNHGLTPLGKCQYWGFLKVLLSSKACFCNENVTKYFFSVYIAWDEKLKTSQIFDHTNGLTPFNWKNAHRRTGREGRGGLQPPTPSHPRFWVTQIFWAARENLGKARF